MTPGREPRDYGPEVSPSAGREMVRRSAELAALLGKRRSIRSFGSSFIPLDVIKNCVSAAASAPSGANDQPWSFVVVSDPAVKRAIRREAEAVEREFYERRVTAEWREKLRPLGTGPEKPFLEKAQYLVCVFVQRHGFDPRGKKVTHHYPVESVGIAVGFLLCTLHMVGVSTLTYTPAPMTFLTDLLARPRNERPFLIVAAGRADEAWRPPPIAKKRESEYLTVL